MLVQEGERSFFVTSNLSLCGYLEIKGLKFVKAELGKGRRGEIVVKFMFLDPENRGTDLSHEFNFSDEKKYKDSLFNFRKVINDLLGK